MENSTNQEEPLAIPPTMQSVLRNERQMADHVLAKEYEQNPDVWVTLRLGNVMWEEHEERDLATVNSVDSGFGDYEWLVKRNNVTTTVRLRFCDVMCLIETCEYLHDHDEMDSRIRGLARRMDDSVRKQLKKQGLPCLIRSVNW